MGHRQGLKKDGGMYFLVEGPPGKLVGARVPVYVREDVVESNKTRRGAGQKGRLSDSYHFLER